MQPQWVEQVGQGGTCLEYPSEELGGRLTVEYFISTHNNPRFNPQTIQNKIKMDSII